MATTLGRCAQCLPVSIGGQTMPGMGQNKSHFVGFVFLQMRAIDENCSDRGHVYIYELAHGDTDVLLQSSGFCSLFVAYATALWQKQRNWLRSQTQQRPMQMLTWKLWKTMKTFVAALKPDVDNYEPSAVLSHPPWVGSRECVCVCVCVYLLRCSYLEQ